MDFLVNQHRILHCYRTICCCALPMACTPTVKAIVPRFSTKTRWHVRSIRLDLPIHEWYCANVFSEWDIVLLMDLHGSAINLSGIHLIRSLKDCKEFCSHNTILPSSSTIQRVMVVVEQEGKVSFNMLTTNMMSRHSNSIMKRQSGCSIKHSGSTGQLGNALFQVSPTVWMTPPQVSKLRIMPLLTRSPTGHCLLARVFCTIMWSLFPAAHQKRNKIQVSGGLRAILFFFDGFEHYQHRNETVSANMFARSKGLGWGGAQGRKPTSSIVATVSLTTVWSWMWLVASAGARLLQLKLRVETATIGP